jgi:hypothetical protein
MCQHTAAWWVHVQVEAASWVTAIVLLLLG